MIKGVSNLIDSQKKHIVEITDYTYDGLGIGKINNFPLFVSNAVVGETVEVKITKLKKNLAFAEITEIKTIGAMRENPPCKYYDECGGCHLMHLRYEEQLRFKTNHVRETLKRIGGIDTEALVNDCIGMEFPFNYRNKLIIPFSKGLAGLYKKGTHDIVDIEECHILNKEALEIVKYLNKLPVNKLIRNVMVRNSHYRNELMVVIITWKPISLSSIGNITKEFPGIVSVINNINDQNSNVILGKRSYILIGEDSYKDYMFGNTYEINHRSFYQINTMQTELLYKKTIESVDLKDKVVVDAYCGIGTIGISCAGAAKKVYGIEVVEAAVNSARDNAEENGVNNIEFFLGKAEEVISTIITEEVDVVIVDPPRKGCQEEFLQSIIDNKIKDFVYVSCNVSTLARDINFLSNHYDVLEVTPFDMFPHTYHVECVARLKLK